MKKYFVTAITVFSIATSALGQVMLEHTYPLGNGTFLGYGEEGYSTYDSSTRTWRHYSPSHQLVRTIVIPEVSGFTAMASSYYGTGLFSSENSFQYLVTYNGANNDRVIRVYGESGSQLFTKSCNLCYALVGPMNGQPKLMIVSPSETEVYSLGGQWQGWMSADDLDEALYHPLFPNPSSSFVTIDVPQSGVLTVTDLLGQQVLSMPVQHSGSVTLPVYGWGSGTYIISVNGQHSQRLIVR